MAYVINENALGFPLITATDTTAKIPLGTIVRASDPTYGVGEFIYLKGLDSTVAGSWVTYNSDDWSTTLLAGSAKGPVAVAMSANVTGQFGWYHIHGKGLALAADVSDGNDVYIDTAAGAGFCDDAAVTGDRVQNAKWASDDDTGTNLAEVEIARPFVDDNVGGYTT